MSYIKLKDIFEIVLEEFKSKIPDTFIINEYKKDELDIFCSMIESLPEECCIEGFSVEVDENTYTTTISIECEEMVIYRDNKEIYEYIKKAESVEIEFLKEDYIVIRFKFSNIWDDVGGISE